MDKFFLLTYTRIYEDGVRHGNHAWFQTEEQLRNYVQKMMQADVGFESDLAIEILDKREIEL